MDYGDADNTLNVVVGQAIIWVLVLVLMSISLLVIVRYVQLWRVHRQALIPLHVWTIALSYYLLLLTLMTQVTTWRIVIYLPALLLGIFSMWTLWRAQHNWRRRHPATADE